MSNSLREQLLKAGLVSREQARKADQSRRQQNRKARQAAGGKSARRVEKSVATREAEARRQAQAERDRALNRSREEQRQRKALNARLKQIVKAESQNHAEADVRHYFPSGARLRYLYVTAEQQPLLASGRLAIVRLHGRHHLVSAEAAEKLTALDPELFVFRRDPSAPDPDGDHPVPDDLVW